MDSKRENRSHDKRITSLCVSIDFETLIEISSISISIYSFNGDVFIKIKYKRINFFFNWPKYLPQDLLVPIFICIIKHLKCLYILRNITSIASSTFISTKNLIIATQ